MQCQNSNKTPKTEPRKHTVHQQLPPPPWVFFSAGDWRRRVGEGGGRSSPTRRGPSSLGRRQPCAVMRGHVAEVWTVRSAFPRLTALPCKVLEGSRSPTGRGKATGGARSQTAVRLTSHALTPQVLLTLNILKNKQKASSEEGKYIFSYRFLGLQGGEASLLRPSEAFPSLCTREGQTWGRWFTALCDSWHSDWKWWSA